MTQTLPSAVAPPNPTSSPDTSPNSTTGTAHRSWLARALREPLLHFLIAGGLIFAADSAFTARRGDPQVITIPAAVRTEAAELFTASLKRSPTDAEMKTLVERWVDNEVLYREGLTLGLDRGDSSIRERVIFKALSVTQAGIPIPTTDEAGLKAWFESHRDRYDKPARYDFQEATWAVEPKSRTPERARVFVDALNGRGESDEQSGLNVFKDRPEPTITKAYGSEFTQALGRLAPLGWAILPSSEGLRIVRLESVQPGETALFDAIKERVYQEWKDDTMSRLTTAAIRDMGRKYPVREEARR